MWKNEPMLYINITTNTFMAKTSRGCNGPAVRLKRTSSMFLTRIALGTDETLHITLCMNVTIHFFFFYLEIVLQTSFLQVNCYNLSANLVGTIQKLTFVTFLHSSNGFLTIMPGVRLPETENKRIYQISGP